MLQVVTFDEQVILAAQFGRQAALNYFLQKWEQPKNRLVTALAKQHGLREQDTADARQEAVFWVVDAIEQYRFSGPPTARGYRMKAFLRVAIKRRMSNFVRALRRKNRLVIPLGITSKRSDVAMALIEHLQGSAYDHTAHAAANDLVESVRRKVAILGQHHETVFLALENGEPLRSAADRLALSYKQTRRIKQQIESVARTVQKPR